MATRQTDKARESGLQFDMLTVFIGWFLSGQRGKLRIWFLVAGQGDPLANDLRQGLDPITDAEEVSRVHRKDAFALSYTQGETVLRASEDNKLSTSLQRISVSQTRFRRFRAESDPSTC